MANPNSGAELNRLYWESDASVSEIGDRLDISRRALYDGIEPRPAGVPCPECGAGLVYRNRTARDGREAECPECGHTTTLSGAAGPDGDTATSSPEAQEEAGSGAEGAQPGTRGLPLPDAEQAPVLGAAFVAGLAVGALAAYVLGRR
ncbi:MAG: hypothetical protein ACOCUW_05100 [Gemmatimonadota bacterium]